MLVPGVASLFLALVAHRGAVAGCDGLRPEAVLDPLERMTRAVHRLPASDSDSVRTVRLIEGIRSGVCGRVEYWGNFRRYFLQPGVEVVANFKNEDALLGLSKLHENPHSVIRVDVRTAFDFYQGSGVSVERETVSEVLQEAFERSAFGREGTMEVFDPQLMDRIAAARSEIDRQIEEITGRAIPEPTGDPIELLVGDLIDIKSTEITGVEINQTLPYLDVTGHLAGFATFHHEFLGSLSKRFARVVFTYRLISPNGYNYNLSYRSGRVFIPNDGLYRQADYERMLKRGT